MPTTREKGSRGRATSTSSDGLPSGSLPSPKGHAPHDDDSPSLEVERDLSLLKVDLIPSLLLCCNPRGCALGPIDQTTPDTSVIRVACNYDKCPYSSLMHLECFEVFEEQVLSCLRGMSRAKNWSEKQRRQNVWTKKGYDLIFKFCTCRCGKGSLRKDLNHVLPEPSASSTVTISTGGGGGGKKKRRKSASTSDKSCVTMPVKTRSRSHKNSDSLSSDNGTAHMQPFAHRTEYTIFNRILPRHLINSYQIKMEDDGYAAGDDARSFVLSSLAFHHTSRVYCVFCDDQLLVYDRYPLVNGTFFLSPVRPKVTSLEVEGKGDDPAYLSVVCVRCMAGINRVTCVHCQATWNGLCHQIGTMYSYNILAAMPCCPARVQCNGCQKPILDVSKLTVSFSQLSSLYECPHCSSRDFHFLKPIVHFAILKSPDPV